ncbi:MAG: penicillin-insensitive murein endopeptidase [Pseudomonadota bacterium]
MRPSSLSLVCAALIALASPAPAQTPAKELFGAVPVASDQRPQPFGSYARGCVAGAVALPETGPRWQAMRLSRNRNWGHPDAIRFIERLSLSAVDAGWAGLYIGDISQPRGGPMLTGHRSHQMGLDIDIWMKPALRLDLTRQEREEISSISVRSADQRRLNANWTDAHFEIMKAAASDPDVARIFVTAPVKQHMCRVAGQDRAWLRKIRPWWGHHYHFHVRLNCPADADGCVEQDPIPAGDGCDGTLAWWTSDEALNPPPPKPGAPRPQPRRELTMASLPQACATVLTSQ